MTAPKGKWLKINNNVVQLGWGTVGKGEDRVTDVARPAVLLGPVVPFSSCGSLHGIHRNLACKLEAGARRADGNESGIHPLAD